MSVHFGILMQSQHMIMSSGTFGWWYVHVQVLNDKSILIFEFGYVCVCVCVCVCLFVPLNKEKYWANLKNSFFPAKVWTVKVTWAI